VLVYDAHHKLAHAVKTKAQPWIGVAGPGADEVTTAERDGFNVYGLDGTPRRTIPGANDQTSGQPVFAADARHAVFLDDGTLTLVDLVAATSRRLATNVRNELSASDDGRFFAYLDHDARVHVMRTDGTEVRVLKPEIRTVQVAFASDGSLIAAASDRELEVFDDKGTSLSTFDIAPEQYQFALRGSDAWTSGNDGNIRHYQHGVLVADRPAHVTPVRGLVLAGDSIISLGEDSTLVVARADEQELKVDPDVCAHPSFGPVGALDYYACPGEPLHVYIGREHLLDLPGDSELMLGDLDEASGRIVIRDQTGLSVFEHGGALLAHLPEASIKNLGDPSFIDKDHLYLLEEKKAVYLWTVSTNERTKLFDMPGVYGAIAIPGGLLVGTSDNKLLRVVDGKVVHTADLKDRAEYLGVSHDRRWAVAQLTNGATAIIDTSTGEITRQLEPAEQSGGIPVFDATGDLILRLARSELTVWDRATGDELVFNFRMLNGMMGGRFMPDGRIEAASRSPVLLDIPLDTRPAPQIIREIACRVPLAATGGRLEPSTPKCE
jgi:hypothetical protein